MIHYQLTREERTQIDGRWHEGAAPLCSTGDGHYKSVDPRQWSGRGKVATVTCRRCCELKHLVARRERDKVYWEPEGEGEGE